MLSLDRVWNAKLYLLDEGRVPLGSIQPNSAVLQELEPGQSGEQIWPPMQRARTVGARPHAHPGWELALAIEEASEEEDVQEHLPEEEDDDDDDNDHELGDDLQGQAELDDLILCVEAEELLEQRHAAKKERKKRKRGAEGEGPSSSAAAPAEPLAEPVRRGPDLGSRAAAAASLTLASGTISYYPSTRNFQATCHIHDRCVLTRVGQECKRFSLSKGRGRPLGFMAAWLEKAGQYSTKAEHNAATTLAALSQHSRVEARERLLALAGGDVLQGFERQLGTDEAVEPEFVPELLR
eukprot:6239545-Amphidinium_carterae.4